MNFMGIAVSLSDKAALNDIVDIYDFEFVDRQHVRRIGTYV